MNTNYSTSAATPQVAEFNHNGKAYRLYLYSDGSKELYYVKKDGNQGQPINLHPDEGYCTKEIFALLGAGFEAINKRLERSNAPQMSSMYHRHGSVK